MCQTSSLKDPMYCLYEIRNILINIWVLFIQNFIIIIFNYFGAMIVLCVQFLGLANNR